MRRDECDRDVERYGCSHSFCSCSFAVFRNLRPLLHLLHHRVAEVGQAEVLALELEPELELELVMRRQAEVMQEAVMQEEATLQAAVTHQLQMHRLIRHQRIQLLPLQKVTQASAPKRRASQRMYGATHTRRAKVIARNMSTTQSRRLASISRRIMLVVWDVTCWRPVSK